MGFADRDNSLDWLFETGPSVGKEGRFAGSFAGVGAMAMGIRYPGFNSHHPAKLPGSMITKPPPSDLNQASSLGIAAAATARGPAPPGSMRWREHGSRRPSRMDPPGGKHRSMRLVISAGHHRAARGCPGSRG